MEDKLLIKLFEERNQQALQIISEQYGKLCYHVAYRILDTEEDTMECLNDTWLNAWEHIPPDKPASMKAYLVRITRNLALNTYKAYHTQKRFSSTVPLSLDELSEVIGSDSDEASKIIDNMALSETLNRFLKQLPKRDRILFVRRYFYMDSIAELSERYGLKEGNVKVILHRVRNKLKKELLKEELL